MAENIEGEAAPAQDTPQEKQEYTKPSWLDVRHSWYANLNITIKQIDIVIAIACGALAVTAILIALDAMNII